MLHKNNPQHIKMQDLEQGQTDSLMKPGAPQDVAPAKDGMKIEQLRVEVGKTRELIRTHRDAFGRTPGPEFSYENPGVPTRLNHY